MENLLDGSEVKKELASVFWNEYIQQDLRLNGSDSTGRTIAKSSMLELAE